MRRGLRFIVLIPKDLKVKPFAMSLSPQLFRTRNVPQGTPILNQLSQNISFVGGLIAEEQIP